MADLKYIILRGPVNEKCYEKRHCRKNLEYQYLLFQE